MTDDRHLITNCTFCGDYFGEPPTAPVIDAHTGYEFDDFWVETLEPNTYPGDYARADVYHRECWRTLETLMRQVKNQSLEAFA